MDFGSRFGDSDSSDDEEDGDTSTPKASSPKQSRFIKPLPRNPSSSDRLHKSMANLRVGESSKTREEQPKRSPLAEQGLQGQAQAQKEPQPVETPAPEKPSDSDRLVQLQAELNPSTLGAKLQAREENETGEKKDRSHELPQRLREIFGLPETEEIITGKFRPYFVCCPANHQTQSIHAGYLRVFSCRDTFTLQRGIYSFTHTCPRNR